MHSLRFRFAQEWCPKFYRRIVNEQFAKRRYISNCLNDARNYLRFCDIFRICEFNDVRTLSSGILMVCGSFTRVFVKDSFATGFIQPWVRAYKFVRFKTLAQQMLKLQYRGRNSSRHWNQYSSKKYVSNSNSFSYLLTLCVQ